MTGTPEQNLKKKKKHSNGDEVHEEMLNIREMQIKTTWDITSYIWLLLKRWDNWDIGEDVEKIYP